MKWNLRMVAAQRDLWRPTELLEAFKTVGFTPSLSKVAAMWSGTPVTVRLDDLDKICAVPNCTVGDLLQAEPLEDAAGESEELPKAPTGARPADARSAGQPSHTAAELTDGCEISSGSVPGLPGLGSARPNRVPGVYGGAEESS
ncbi:helix-turn-helix domain-containing protein [Streptomyces sp. NPDC087270]|uniref:helix-turn-helix domain-containing protein n=1 Tax=Streptomyces sp. NPDC087270 TaxID=3365774 RepID=UPI0037FCFC01